MILREIWSRSGEHDGWWVGDYILLPDHVHLFARCEIDAKPLAAWMEMWKSVSSRRIAKILGSSNQRPEGRPAANPEIAPRVRPAAGGPAGSKHGLGLEPARPRAARRSHAPERHFWQADYFDRYLRSSESYAEKWDYVEQNAVRAGLVTKVEDWPYRGRIHELRF